MTDDACLTCGPICGMREFEAPSTERRRQLREMARDGQQLEKEADHE